MRLPWGYGGMSGRYGRLFSPHSTENSKEPVFLLQLSVLQQETGGAFRLGKGS